MWFAASFAVLLLLNCLFRPFGPFNVFRRAVSRNSNFDATILWARQVIADTNTQAARFDKRETQHLESMELAKERLPTELATLGQGLFGGKLEAPHAVVWRNYEHTESFMTIGFDLRLDESLGIVVGQTNFTMPPWLGRKQGLKRAEKCRDGVFFYEAGT